MSCSAAPAVITKMGGRRVTAKVRIPIHSGELGKFGYSTHIAQKTRRNALRKAVGAYGPLSVFRKLNAVGTLTKRTSKQSSHKFIKDRNWIRKNYM